MRQKLMIMFRVGQVMCQACIHTRNEDPISVHEISDILCIILILTIYKYITPRQVFLQKFIFIAYTI